jgi:hypothetical protein
MARVELPPPRPILWPLRPPGSARVWSSHDGGRAVIGIEHAPLRSVTAEMLTWWYGHVPGLMPYAGRTYPRYLVWHPLDHISYQLVRPDPRGRVGPGALVHVTEALGRDPGHVIDIRVAVQELGDGRAVVGKQIAGTTVVRIENEFQTGPAGATYVSRLTIGDRTALGRLLLNRVAHRAAFPPQRIEPWIRHHIEEIGNLENFLPDLFASRAEHEP